MNILILGASGMLGSAVFRVLAADPALETWGTLRSPAGLRHFPPQARARLLTGIDVLDFDTLSLQFARLRPDVVINCIGLIKQLADAADPLQALPVNAMLPHRLARLCDLGGARLVQISTDCVFSGQRGNYRETDRPDATDLYGQSKYLGELRDLTHAITLRTSIIGHELDSSHSLIDWFLSRQGSVRGFSRAIFSGLPTVELASVIRTHILPRPDLHGLYHVAAQPIAKLDLLRLVAERYGKHIDIEADPSVVIDRSLDASRFHAATGYRAAAWPQLIARMHEDSLHRA